MSLVIVPDFLSDEIHAALDRQLDGMPEAAQKCRPHLFNQLLAYYNEHGEIPQFTVVKHPTGKEGEK